ncbi:MAG: D-aminoacyl-tRNA deacylase [Sphingobacterium sp.]|uniref:D-aminoacyl-tRNA deacylase n=1 Tax=Sphingobacterium sp. JB170 TaxID=1434842 RepID=UPI000B359369|nr:D-aminoacyl-tRNA deacylase [Sphingobacterium sp. JB170]
MRAVIQRVNHASCTVEGIATGTIKHGLVIFLGIEDRDDHTDISWLANKIVNMRIFSDEQGLMNKSILDRNGEILLISQFTLFAHTKKGNRPSFIRAANPEFAKTQYQMMATTLNNLLKKAIQLGRFGADMKIDLENDGPVTIIMDTNDKDNF